MPVTQLEFVAVFPADRLQGFHGLGGYIDPDAVAW
jgi:hypothetical protein